MNENTNKNNNNKSNQGLIVFLIVCIFIDIVFVADLARSIEPKKRCAKYGCDFECAPGSSYCYVHKSSKGRVTNTHKTSTYNSNSYKPSTTEKTHTYDTSYKRKTTESKTCDPMDHDIDTYYDDYRDEFEDEDDAWDDFEDDDDYWDDY